jgi:hypothetical protein
VCTVSEYLVEAEPWRLLKAYFPPMNNELCFQAESMHILPWLGIRTHDTSRCSEVQLFIRVGDHACTLTVIVYNRLFRREGTQPSMNSISALLL